MTRWDEIEGTIGDVSDYDPHIYEGERCVVCNVNVYDDAIYGPFDCVRDRNRDPISYTTETGYPGHGVQRDR